MNYYESKNQVAQNKYNTNNSAVVRMKPEVLKSEVSGIRQAIEKSLPRGIDIDNFLQQVYLEFINDKTGNLLKCSAESIRDSVLNCATLGLVPNSIIGHIYFTSNKNNKCGIMLGYKGMIELIRRSGLIQSITVQSVYEGDIFEIEYGSFAKLRHLPSLNIERKDENIICFYAFMQLKDGGSQFDTITKKDVDAIMHRSPSYKNSKAYNKECSWTTDYSEMGKKTILRRMFKSLPISIESMQKAVEIEDREEIDDGAYVLEHNNENSIEEKNDKDWSPSVKSVEIVSSLTETEKIKEIKKNQEKITQEVIKSMIDSKTIDELKKAFDDGQKKSKVFLEEDRNLFLEDIISLKDKLKDKFIK